MSLLKSSKREGILAIPVQMRSSRILLLCFLAAAGLLISYFSAMRQGGPANIIQSTFSTSLQPAPLHIPGHGKGGSHRDREIQTLLDSLASRERRESFSNIFETNHWGNAESRSGDGSSMHYTENVRKLLAHAIKTYDIRHWIDSPCGDCNWQWKVEGIDNLQYLGLDIVPALIQHDKEKHADKPFMNFKVQDFVSEPFPPTSGMILCRDMIQHNSLEDGVRAYYNMEKSGAKYLVTTWHDRGQSNPLTHNVNVPPGGMYEVNVFLHPFNFSRPEFFIREGFNGSDGQGKTVGFFKLPALGMGDGAFFDFSEHATKAQSELVTLA